MCPTIMKCIAWSELYNEFHNKDLDMVAIKKGGTTDADNRQMLCRECNRRKSGK